MINNYIKGLSFPVTHPFYKDSKRAEEKFHIDAYVKDGIVRWISNNKVPPSELLEFWKHLGKDFDYLKSMETSENETLEFIREYVKQKKDEAVTDEERFELEAAFGKGTTVIDVFTGKETYL